MKRTMSEVTRRDVLGGGALLGALAILSGCQGSRGQLAGPVWPDEQTGASSIPPPPGPSTPWPSPAPQPNVRVAGPQGVVLPRTAWTSAQPKWRVSKPMNGVQRITIHHDAINSSGMRSERESITRLNSIRNSHLQRGSEWVDIGYHYIIDPSGRVWQGRPVSIEGAHVSKTNEHNLGVMLMGNFEQQSPTREQIETLDGFVASQMRLYRVPVSRVYTHQELKGTACPGRNLQGYMMATRRSSGRLANA